MADSGLLKTFKRIFSISKPGEFSSRLDIDHALSATNRPLAPTPMVRPNIISDKGVQTGTLFVTDTISGQNYYRYLQRETVRHTLYSLYDRMDNDLMASALDVYANEATQKNYDNVIVDVSSSSKYIEDELKDMLELVGINNYKSWSIVREMCKYGDHFESLVLDSRQGVVGLKTLDPRSVYRIERDGDLVGYIQDMSIVRQALSQESASTATMNPYINLNTLAIPYLSKSAYNKDNSQNDDIEEFTKYELLHFRIRGRNENAPYGTSVFMSCVDMWKKLDLLVDSLIVYRLNRAPSRLVFYVDVGNNQGSDVENLVRKQINSINKKEFFDQSSGKINERYQLLDMNANIFIPVKQNSQSKVEMLQGASNVGDIEDMKYLNDRLFSALKVPKSFLGFDGDVNSKATLSQQNVTFGRAVQNLQEDFLDVIRDLCIIHLAVKGVSTTADLTSFDLLMTRPSYIEEKARIELESTRIALAQSYQQFGINNKWIAKHILIKSDNEIVEMFVPNPAPAGEGGGGGGMMGGGGLGMLGGGEMPTGGEEGLGEVPPVGAAPPEAGGAEMAPPVEGGAPMEAGAAAAPPAEAAPLQQNRAYAGEYIQEGRQFISTKLTVRSPNSEVRNCVQFLYDDIASDFENQRSPLVIGNHTDPGSLFD